MRSLLLVACCLFSYATQAQGSKPRVLGTSNTALFEKLIADLDASRLLRRYRADLKLRRVTRNRHEPAVKDSILTVATTADHLDLFKNRYKAMLRGATITSTRVSFGGMRVGVSKEQFCRTLHLRTGYDEYAFTDGMENFVQLTCTFANGTLKQVEYRELVDLDAID